MGRFSGPFCFYGAQKARKKVKCSTLYGVERLHLLELKKQPWKAGPGAFLR